MKLLEGKVAFISGIGDGLGLEAARLFAQQGAKLVLTARRASALKAYAEEIEKLGAACEWVVCDILKAPDCQAAVEAAMGRFGAIDVLVNNAFRADQLAYRTILEADPNLENWRGIIETNIFGTLQMVRAAAPIMAKQRSGNIIIVNSMAAELVHEGQAGYAGSKAALVTFGRSLALELGPYGVRVNNYHPGWMWGPNVQGFLEQRAEKNGTSLVAEKAAVEKEMALRRMPTTADCAKPLLFLASDLSSPITGQAIHANGGHYFH